VSPKINLLAGTSKIGSHRHTTLRRGTGIHPARAWAKEPVKMKFRKSFAILSVIAATGGAQLHNAHALTLSDALDPPDRYCRSVPPVEAVGCFEMAQAIVRSVSELRKSDVHRVFGQCREILNER
jgi:hypothetical protein